MSKSVIFDPGHGGTDPGASGFGVREKDWALKISLYQYKRMKELGAKVGITRTDDRTLTPTQRTNLIRGKYDIAVSNHWNAFNGVANGIETIHSVYNNGRFAKVLADALIKATGLRFRRVFSRKNTSGGDYFFMHRMTGNTSTVIVEYGFIDNKADNDWYKNEANFTKAAEAVIEAVCKEIGIKYVAPSGQSAVKTGWIKNKTGWWYRNADSSYPKSGWLKVKGVWYLFDKRGYMLTGWHKVKGTWYYMESSGAMATGWKKVNGTWYYLHTNGAMRTGLITVNGKHYYLERSGALITDESIELEANKHGHLN